MPPPRVPPAPLGADPRQYVLATCETCFGAGVLQLPALDLAAREARPAPPRANDAAPADQTPSPALEFDGRLRAAVAAFIGTGQAPNVHRVADYVEIHINSADLSALVTDPNYPVRNTDGSPLPEPAEVWRGFRLVRDDDVPAGKPELRTTWKTTI